MSRPSPECRRVSAVPGALPLEPNPMEARP
jgi:hypothetical protein